MAKNQDCIVEMIMELCALYLKLGESIRTSSSIRPNKDSIFSDPVADGIFLREEILKKLFDLLQKLHCL